jgi:hypothetical protein
MHLLLPTHLTTESPRALFAQEKTMSTVDRASSPGTEDVSPYHYGKNLCFLEKIFRIGCRSGSSVVDQ